MDLTADGATARRRSARGLVLDDDGRYVLIRRRRPDGPRYLVAPGGGVEQGESWADAVRRECREELGAEVVVGDVVLATAATGSSRGGEQRFLLSRLVSIDAGASTGHELRDPARGTYETVRIGVDDDELSNLRPRELAELIRERHPVLARQAAALGRTPR